ncbi:MAG: hypothetical protein DCC58_20415 [Chloroflexi bacterium]|nr:MAG: hypothetical protein DCC58_20415 [Chloroflexota bacterium]
MKRWRPRESLEASEILTQWTMLGLDIAPDKNLWIGVGLCTVAETLVAFEDDPYHLRDIIEWEASKEDIGEVPNQCRFLLYILVEVRVIDPKHAQRSECCRMVSH